MITFILLPNTPLSNAQTSENNLAENNTSENNTSENNLAENNTCDCIACKMIRTFVSAEEKPSAATAEEKPSATTAEEKPKEGVNPVENLSGWATPQEAMVNARASEQTPKLEKWFTSKVSETPLPATPKAEVVNVASGYETLASVLALALDQAQSGKGKERHQVGSIPFSQQPICELARLYGVGYNFGQSAKKAHETQQLKTKTAKQAELLGAINYLAAAYLVISEQD